MAGSPDPYLDPKGIFTGSQEPADQTREFGATTGPRPRVQQNRRTPPRGSRTLNEPKRKMSRGSTIAAWVLAFIVVLYVLGMVSQFVHPDSNVGPHPAPTVTVTHTVKAKQ